MTAADHGRQARQALAIANVVRTAHAALKDEIASLPAPEARALIADVLRDADRVYDGMTLDAMLGAINNWGPLRVGRFLNVVAIRPGKKVGSLTERQRELIGSELR